MLAARLIRTVAALGSVGFAYLLYALIAVPLIEPSVRLAPAGPSYAAEPRTRSFEKLFPAGSWELDRPKILETEQGTLLFDDYRPLDGGRRIRLNRCTFIRFLASKPLDATASPPARDAQRGRPVIMRATDGAILDFDSPLDVASGEFGKLSGGQLAGDVVITGPPSAPDAQDALRFTTRDVQIDARRIWTPHDVEFEYGPHRGRGRDLRIEWSQATLPPTADGSPRVSVGGIRTLELVHLERLELQVPADKSAGSPHTLGRTPPEAERRAAPTTGKAATVPAEVACRGPLRIDFDQQVAVLSEQVQLLRHNLDGAADQLRCEVLEIYFGAEVAADGAVPKNSADRPTQWQARRLVALGGPASVHLGSRNADIRAGRIEYDLLDRTIRLVDEHQVRIVDGTYDVEAKQLEYELAETGRLGRLWAQGPGRLHAKAGERHGELQAAWEQEVRLRPHENNLVLSLLRGSVAFNTEQHFSADEMHLFLVETTASGPGEVYGVAPDRLKAVGNVKLDSPRMSALVREGNLWFVRQESATRSPAGQTTRWQAAQPAAGNVAKNSAVESKYDLQADVLQAQVLLGSQPQVQRLTLQTNIRFRQLQGDTRQALSLEGEVLEIQDAHTTAARAVLIGNPARVAAGEMQLVGGEFQLAQAENSLQVLGPGSMTLPAPSTAPRPLPPLQVAWQGGMRFNGRLALFDRQVHVQGSSVQANGELVKLQGTSDSIHVTLTQRIDFTQPEAARQVDVAEMAFDSEVLLQSESLDPAGQLKASQRTAMRNLRINRTTGELRGDGPGWISSVHRREPGVGEPLPAAPEGQPSSGIEYLRIQFLRGLEGNLHYGEIAFLERVKAVYGPVAAWDQTLDETQPPGPTDSFVISDSDRLAVADMSSRAGTFKDMELEATGNAVVRGSNFSATAQRICYVRSKDQVIAEGDGRNEAILKYQPAQSHTVPVELKAGKILFCPSTRQFELNGVRALELRNIQQLRSPAPRP